MSHIHGTASNYLTLSDALVAAATGNSLASVGISSGGTGYTVGDVLTVAGGTATVAAQIEVTSVASGVIDGVRVFNSGAYSANPSSPNSAAGGTGSGASLTLTMADNGWIAELDSTWSGSQKEVVLSSTGDGGDAIFVGWRTLSNLATYYNWELHGMTGYISGQHLDSQPGVSPGFHDAGVTANRAGAYLLLLDASIEYWFYIDAYHIRLDVKVGSNYFNAYMGWADRYMTEAEYPYPMVIGGHSSQWNDVYNQSTVTSGITDPWRSPTGDGSTAGPMFVRFLDGQWHSVTNQRSGTVSVASIRERTVLPAAHPGSAFGNVSGDPAVEARDLFMNSTATFIDLLPNTGAAATAVANLESTPGTTDVRVLFPTLISFCAPSVNVVLELRGVYWASGAGGVFSEDRIVVGGVVYRMFQNCNRSSSFAFLAMRED
jgi:hypothetical protein